MSGTLVTIRLMCAAAEGLLKALQSGPLAQIIVGQGGGIYIGLTWTFFFTQPDRTETHQIASWCGRLRCVLTRMGSSGAGSETTRFAPAVPQARAKAAVSRHAATSIAHTRSRRREYRERIRPIETRRFKEPDPPGYD
jgi:hypothetical protein